MMSEEKQSAADLIEDMKRRLRAEREKHGYSIDDPVDPIRNKSGTGRMLLSVFLVILLTLFCVVIVSAVASQNAGQPIGYTFIGNQL